MRRDKVQQQPHRTRDLLPGSDHFNQLMNSTRFQRPVIVTYHARQRMAERGISEEICWK